MKKLTDQELDSLFKAASEGYQPEFDAAAWEAMTEKFKQPKPGLWKKWIPISLLGLTIFSTGIWVGINLNQDSRYEEKELKTQISNHDKKGETENKVENIAGSSPEAKQDVIGVHNVSSKAPAGGSKKFLRANQHEINDAKDDADLIDFRNESLPVNLSVNDNEVHDYKITLSENQVDTILTEKFEKEIDTDTTQTNNIKVDHKKITKSSKEIFNL